MIGKVSEFLSNVKSELKKTTWPTKKDTYGSTVVVIALVIAVAVFLWLVDTALSGLVKYLLS
ncbi:MAG: preprotein translocase subunit SecE [Desulfuromonas sp.]|nr:MAG: preprotein translocase subunit SecE [Desulfuromonas sp.]